MTRFLGILLRIALLIVVLAAVALAGRKLMDRKRKALAQSPKFELAAAPVDVVSASRGDLDEGHDSLAVTEPMPASSISVRITATIERVHVQEGATVAKGDGLVTLDSRQFREASEYYDIRVMVPEARLTGEADLENLVVGTRQGESVYLRDIAEVRRAVGPVEIVRENQAKQVVVRADSAGISVGEAVSRAQAAVNALERPPRWTSRRAVRLR